MRDHLILQESCLSLRDSDSVCRLLRRKTTYTKILVWVKLCNVPLDFFSEVLVI